MHAGYEVSQVFLYRDPVDFRKSIDGLAAIVEMELRMNIFSGALFPSSAVPETIFGVFEGLGSRIQ
jgi:hypothetical protein